MHCLIVLAHPEATSLNAHLASEAAKNLGRLGHTVDLLDLYQEGFEPREASSHYAGSTANSRFQPLIAQRSASQEALLPHVVQREIERIEAADLVLFQFPLWWFSPPAILKGWLDRVFVSGGVYTSRTRYETGRFKGKRAIVSFTAGSARTARDPAPDALDPELWALHFSLYYVGFTVLPPLRHLDIDGASAFQDAAGAERCRHDMLAYLAGLPTHQPLNDILAVFRNRYDRS